MTMGENFQLQHYLEGPVERTPGKIAVTDGTLALSYRELSTRADDIARGLRDLGVKRQDRVGICLPRTAWMLSAILGSLKAGACYVPLDQKSPLQRLEYILDDALPAAVVCDQITLPLLQQSGRCRAGKTALLALTLGGEVPTGVKTLEQVREGGGAPPVCISTPDDLAYVLYTSGSTGRPKGVMISHANVAAYIDWAQRFFQVGATDRLLGTAPFHFDMSTFDIFCALKAGATLCIANDMQLLFPAKLVDFIEREEVTLWKGVASLLMYMARAGVLKPGAMPSLDRVIFAGEALPTRYLIDWMSAFPEKSFYNAYGPTETTGVSLCHRVEAVPASPAERIPIGRPRTGTGVYLLDDELAEVAEGQFGELCLAGAGLARGYLNDPGKTAAAFIRKARVCGGERIYKTGDLACRRPDGNFDYLGRKDRQLKFMGYRIEAGEIERALLALPQIEDAVVQLIDSGQDAGGPELVGFFEAAESVDLAQLALELKQRLPGYMIPRRLVRVARMPRCERGKVQMAVLRQHYQFA